MLALILYSLVGGLFSLVGGILLLSHKKFARKILTPLLAFSAGAFLAASFFDILPEALELRSDPHAIFSAVLVGFVTFFILERLLMFIRFETDGHAHSDHTESLSFLLILGDSVHNFLDGILIAIAYLANPILGITTIISVAAHEIPQEIGDFSVLLNQGWSRGRIIMVNILQSLLTIPGVVLGYYAGTMLEPYLPYLLAAAGGTFIYIAASDLIPEIHHRAGHKHFFKVVIPFLLSVILIAYLVGIAHS